MKLNRQCNFHEKYIEDSKILLIFIFCKMIRPEMKLELNRQRVKSTHQNQFREREIEIKPMKDVESKILSGS